MRTCPAALRASLSGLVVLLALGLAPATAQQKKQPEKKTPAKETTSSLPGGGQTFLIGTFGDWKALMTGKDKQKVCYALSQPKERKPTGLTRNPAYLFISNRMSDNAKHEIAFKLGFPARFGQDGTASVGSATFALVADAKAPNPKEKSTKAPPDSSAFLKNPAQENQLIESLKRASGFSVKLSSIRGNETTDSYSLNGFAKALEAVDKECP